MISPEEKQTQSDSKMESDHMYGISGEEHQSEPGGKSSSDSPGEAKVENANKESTKPTSSVKQKKEERPKCRKLSKHHSKHGLKGVNYLKKSGFRPKGLESMSRQNLLHYISKLENTVNKQHSAIRYLQLKVRKNEFGHFEKCKYPSDESSFAMESHSCITRVAESEKCILNDNCANRKKFNKGTSESNNENMQNYLSKNVVSKDFSVTHSNVKPKRKELLETSKNSSADKNPELYMENEDTDFTVNKIKNVQSVSGVHLCSDEIKNKSDVKPECDEGVKKCIEEFLFREDISVTDLNVKLEETDRVTRFRRHFLIVLYKQFLAEVGSECTFLQFCKYIPKNVIKSSPTYWKNLLCPRCENTELKFMEIISKVLMKKNLSLEEVLAKQDLFEHVSLELGKLKDSQTPFTYRSWARTLLGKMEASERIVTTTVGSACTDILKQLDLLKEHMTRCFNQYEAVKEAREETEISPIHALVHIDWYESPATFVARLLHTSYYYGNGFKSLHAGFVRTKEKSFGFASLSDCRDHTAPAVWASINNILVSLAKEGMKVITIVSDSATAQYRNKGNFYLMRRFAKQNNVEMKWIYLEGGHGKGIADAVGGSVKQLICDAIGKHPNKSFRNTMDILPLIKDEISVKVFSHSEQLVQQYKNLLSRQHLQVIPSTYKIHEVCVKETSFYVKESSADKLPFFSLDLDTQSKGT